jgi:hypothetical protein
MNRASIPAAGVRLRHKRALFTSCWVGHTHVPHTTLRGLCSADKLQMGLQSSWTAKWIAASRDNATIGIID